MNSLPENASHPAAMQSSGRIQCFLETALVFLVIFIQGAWPVPECNEPYYLTKAIHFWNPDYIANDFFLSSADTHTVFYFTFGWLTLLLSPTFTTWTGRIIAWVLLAYSWRRLSVAILPRRWWSIFTAALFLYLLNHCYMAGEWVVGGVEAKCFAYVFVFLGLEQMVRNRWNTAWICFGAASLFHVLVGGWSVVAAAIAWGIMGRPRPRLLSMWPGLLVGGLLSLPALIPSLRLTWGVDPQIISQANQIYVFERLPHHLNPLSFPIGFVARFSLLCLLWLFIWAAWRYVAARSSTDENSAAELPLVGHLADEQYLNKAAIHCLHCFVAGSLLITCIGVMISIFWRDDPARAAGLLRFYWFRLSDVAVPLGVALCGSVMIETALRKRPAVGRRWLLLVFIMVAIHFGHLAVLRATPMVPRADNLDHYAYWCQACDWIADPQNIPPQSVFLTPRMSQTFKWYTGHSEVVNRKDVPQDACSIVEWHRRMQDIHADKQPSSSWPWHLTLASQGEQRLLMLGRKYSADYAITASNPRLDLPVVYENPAYIIYKLDR